MIVQFATLEGENKGPQIDVPLGSTVLQMEELMNQLLENENKVQLYMEAFGLHIERAEYHDQILCKKRQPSVLIA